MTNAVRHNQEARTGFRDPEQLTREISGLDPAPVTHFTPDNTEEVMRDFLSGKVTQPNSATYTDLDALDFDAREIRYKSLLEELLAHPEIPSKHHHVYESFVTRALMLNDLMRAAVEYRTAETEQARSDAQKTFNKLNEVLYGLPEDSIAAAMIQEVTSDIEQVDDSELQQIKAEFLAMIPTDLSEAPNDEPLLDPSPPVKELLDRAVQILYTPLLRHADELISLAVSEEAVAEEDIKFGPTAVGLVFQTIIDNEFPGEGWTVKAGKARSIRVDVQSKRITVGENLKPKSAKDLRGAVVHELGVHMVRSIIGEGSDVVVLRTGLAEFSDAEEGIAKLMQSAVTGRISRIGYQHYLTASLLKKGYDFNQTFEAMWRYKAMDEVLTKPDKQVDDELIEKQKEAAFKIVFGAVYGTNELLWTNKLSYFNGVHKMLKYLEDNLEDPDLMTFLFMGKSDPTNPAHVRGALDAKGRV